jgi:hypothetical protein
MPKPTTRPAVQLSKPPKPKTKAQQKAEEIQAARAVKPASSGTGLLGALREINDAIRRAL